MTSASKKTTSLIELLSEYRDCQNCKLGQLRHDRGAPIVFGEGNLDAELMIIGESPGPLEETHIRPFFQKAEAGKYLHLLLEQNNIHRRDIFITNAMICAPLNKNTGGVMDSIEKKSIFGSSLQDQKAIYICNDRLTKTIEIIKPKILVLLGEVAYTSIYGYPPTTVTSVLGWNKYFQNKYKVFVSYHPSYYARLKSKVESMYKTDADYKTNYNKLIDLSKTLKSHWKEISEAYHGLSIQESNLL